MPDRPPKPEDRPSSPRFKKRKKGASDKPVESAPADLGPIIDELKKQSDRGAAIIAGSLIEQFLDEAYAPASPAPAGAA